MAARPLSSAKPALVERVLLRCAGQCTVCRSWSEQHVCTDCLMRYARPVPRCWTCAARLAPERIGHRQPKCGRCLREPPPLSRTIAALDYAFPWDGLLQHYKFHQAIELRETLLDRLRQALLVGEASNPDWLLPVPLTLSRQRERGYNQAYELARSLARRHKLRCEADMLLRVRETSQQAQLPYAVRAANIKGAFAVDPVQTPRLRGQRVVLLDDVMTSGATLYELARVLRQAGAADVQAWVIARTPETES